MQILLTKEVLEIPRGKTKKTGKNLDFFYLIKVYNKTSVPNTYSYRNSKENANEIETKNSIKSFFITSS